MSAPPRCPPSTGSSGRVSFYESGGFADAIQRLVSDRRWRILHDTLEPIRDGGPPEGHMLVFEIG